MRRLLALSHAWLGALSAIFVILVAASGAALAFMSELFMAQYGDALRAAPPSPGAAALDIDALLASAQAGATANGGAPFTPIGVLMPHSRVEGVETAIPFGLPAGGAGFEDLRMYSVDPWTGAFKGDFRLDDAWGHQLVHFHQDLFAGPLGATFVAALGIGLTAFAVSGLWLWWPRHGSAAAKAMRLDLSGGAKRAMFNLHGWAGVWASLAIIFFALTGVAVTRPHWLALPTAVEAPPVSAGFDRTCAGAVSPGQAARAALAAFPDRELTSLYFPEEPGGPYRMTLRAHGDLDRLGGDLVVFAHASCPQLVHAVDLKATGFAAHVAGVSLSLHGGYSFGVAGDVLVVATGFALVLLSIAGLVVFFTRTLRTKKT